MAAARLGSRLVIGAGGTGRTHRLRSWLTERGVDAAMVSASPLSFTTADEIKSAIGEAPDLLVVDDLQWLEPDALRLVADAAKTAAVLASRRPQAGLEPDGDLLDLVVELLTRDEPATRLDLLDLDSFAPALAEIRATVEARTGSSGGGAVPTDELERLHLATGGSVGLTADAVTTGWSGHPDDLTPALVDAVKVRIRRAGAAAAQLVHLWAVAGDSTVESDQLPLSVALGSLTDVDPTVAERAARAGGLVDDDGDLLPLVGWCALADLTAAERAALHDRVAAALAATDRRAAAAHLLIGSGDLDDAAQILAGAALDLAVTEPDRAPRYIDRAEQLGLPSADASLLRALTAFHAGEPDAIAHLDAAHGAAGRADDRAAIVGYGIDVRDLRFDSAARRPIDGDLAEPLRRLADGLAGRIDGKDGRTATDDTADGGTTPLGATMAAVADGIAHAAAGDLPSAIGRFSTAADDYDRLAPTAPFGVTPHTIGALAALHGGDLSVVEILTDQAIGERSGGAGEALTHELLRAFGRLVGGDFGEALRLLREHAGMDAAGGGPDGAEAGSRDSPDDLHDLTDDAGSEPRSDARSDPGSSLPSQRDRLLLASVEAAIARRSGDTTRLRSAWRRAEEALIRPSVSWLLVDPMAELLAAGARVGDTRRVTPIVEALAAQGLGLPEAGPGPAGAHWLRLQVAIASEDPTTVTDAAEAMASLATSDPRSLARAEAASIWSAIAGVDGARGPVTEDEVVGVSERLSEIGDRWEASRVLGQAALDEPDPKAARRLLELARVAATDQVDESAGDGLSALGLSEREAEVALLVVEGRTHKEVGAQLFISPKTVEHHVAKIRQKVGASSRAELLSIIREAVGG